MNDVDTSENNIFWRQPAAFWGILIVGLGCIVAMSYQGIVGMVRVWDVREEYGHGYIIPFIALFLVWQHKDVLERTRFSGSWSGVAIALFGIVIVLVGNLTTIATLMQYGMLVVLIGFVYSYLGAAIRPIITPLLFLVFMIPLPGFFLNNLSSQLQLISSQLGVAVIRLFDISVYLEGNVIDLGTYKLQVVEACSGLNYLFPLMSLAFIAAYFFKASLWKRATIFFTSIPITVLMNSFRIGVIGVLVDNWGIEQAEGFLHYFEGWIIFMACLLILFGEMWLFNRFSAKNMSLMEVFGIEFPEDAPKGTEYRIRTVPKALMASLLVIVLGAIASGLVGARDEIIPERVAFSEFPMNIEGWHGTENSIEDKFLDVLKLDDYIIADYSRSNIDAVNFYSAYYQSQRSGAAAHSPRSCIPGGGWRIKSHDIVKIKGTNKHANRLLIRKGDFGQVVYYWFDQRGRNITNEYMVKWYLFLDSLMLGRSDGSLIRLTTTLQPGEDVAKADQRILEFAKLVNPILPDYIPE
ncbi:MAG: VPLPA-CTERM-specific exosortase XrtD [Methylococcales bacterium]